MMTNKEEFIELLRSTNRDGVEDCIVDLQELGFFEAPASTKFHLNEEGGLVQHSLNLCHVALKVYNVCQMVFFLSSAYKKNDPLI